MVAPKPASTRRRNNKTSTHATLTRDHNVAEPDLPGEGWHPLTVAWWADLWRSPMAPEYDDSDLHGLFLLADLVDQYWQATSTTTKKDLAGEIRLQRQSYGLSPYDRRRLQWQIESTEEAQDKGRQRRARTVSVQRDDGDDPRSALYSA